MSKIGLLLWSKTLNEINNKNGWIFSERYNHLGETHDCYVKNLAILNKVFNGLRFFVVICIEPNADIRQSDVVIDRLYFGVSSTLFPSEESVFEFTPFGDGEVYPSVNSTKVDDNTTPLRSVKELLVYSPIDEGIHFPFRDISWASEPLAHGLEKLKELGITPDQVIISNLSNNHEISSSTPLATTKSHSDNSTGCCVFLVIPLLFASILIICNTLYFKV